MLDCYKATTEHKNTIILAGHTVYVVSVISTFLFAGEVFRLCWTTAMPLQLQTSKKVVSIQGTDTVNIMTQRRIIQKLDLVLGKKNIHKVKCETIQFEFDRSEQVAGYLHHIILSL